MKFHLLRQNSDVHQLEDIQNGIFVSFNKTLLHSDIERISQTLINGGYANGHFENIYHDQNNTIFLCFYPDTVRFNSGSFYQQSLNPVVAQLFQMAGITVDTWSAAKQRFPQT